MPNKWLFLDKFPDDFDVCQDEISTQLLYNRGLKDKDRIEEFFSSDFEKYFLSPALFSQIDKAVDLIIDYIKGGKKVIVYGDYDADGATAAACVYETLSLLKAKIEVYIPERKSEGYGLNKVAIDYLSREVVGGIPEGPTQLIITVDCAIRNKDEVEYAKTKGFEVIITDHHPAPEKSEDLPDCILVNPRVPSEKYPYKHLAGVGVALKLCKAIIDKTKLDDETKNIIFLRLLDLVAIGTVADCVPLLEENRVILKKGLAVLNETKRIGLKELIKIAKINGDKLLDSWNIGFQIAPRINAAGRLDHANTAFELLITKDKDEAETLARHLNGKNQERQALTEEIFHELEAQVNHDDFILIGVTPENESDLVWSEGVVGLVAGKLTEKYHKPALVITKNETMYKGSGRSISEFNLAQALEECRDVLHKYGGHAQAAGFTFEPNNLEVFREKIKSIAKNKLANVDLTPSIKIDMEIPLNKVNEDLVENIARFAPFGQSNPEPIFASRTVQILDKMVMGYDGRHLKLKLKADGSKIINAIGFGQAEKYGYLKIGETIDIVYTAELNVFNGRRDVQIRIIDINYAG